MIKFKSKIVNIFLLLFLFSLLIRAEKKIELIPDIVIGEEERDENYIFGEVGDIEIGSLGEIFILDNKNYRIQKFNEKGEFLLSIGKKGQGPGEFGSFLNSIAVDSYGNLIVREFRKIHVFDKEGQFLISFHTDFQINDLVVNENNEILVLGFKNEKIIHAYNQKGEYLYSFGEPLKIPEGYSKYKKFTLLKIPYKLFYTSNKKLCYINPYQYEIFMYKETTLEKKIKQKSNFYKPSQVLEFERRGTKGISILHINYSFLEHGDKMYISLFNGKECQINLLENYKYVKSIKTKDFPQAIDDQGRIYSVDNSEISKVTRYIVKTL